MGEFLARRTPPPEASQLKLPAIALEPVKPPVEGTPEELPAPSHSPVKPPAPARTAKSAKKPVTSIVLASGAKPIRQTNLSYPVEAQNEHVSGLVEMELTISEDGSVKSPRVLSGDPLLRAGLTEEVSKWVFRPLRVDGKPVPMTTELTIRFNLNP
jgi:TonB family protein